MSKAKFAAARELIKEKNYAAARAVLVSIDDPQALEWLAKLDKIAPEVPSPNPVWNAGDAFPDSRRFYTPDSASRFNARTISLVALLGITTVALVILLIIGANILIPLLNHSGTGDSTNVERLLDRYCRQYQADNATDVASHCQEWTANQLAANADRVQQCYAQADNGQIEETFDRCMFLSVNVVISTSGATPTRSSP
jgi:hypothetical protein